MTAKELAEKINGREYMESFVDVRNAAKDAGLVIVTGASDDLIEFDGAIFDEGGCFDGGVIYFDRKHVANDGERLPNQILAIWCGKVENEPVGDPSEFVDENGETITWTYKTDIPHETFMIYDDGEPYCRGIVFSIEDVKE